MSEEQAKQFQQDLQNGLMPHLSKIEALEALEAQNKMMAEALKRIAEYTHECGCVPCRDQCRSKEALQVTLDCLIDDAREALAQIGEKNDNR